MIYVYKHTNLKNNEVFYVGHGTSNRVYSKTRLSNYYMDYRILHGLNRSDIRIDIICECANKEDARIIEDRYINLYRKTLVNRHSNAEYSQLLRANAQKNSISGATKRSKKVICINDNIEHDSVSAASRFYKIDCSTIIKVCKGTRKAVHKKLFKYV